MPLSLDFPVKASPERSQPQTSGDSPEPRPRRAVPPPPSQSRDVGAGFAGGDAGDAQSRSAPRWPASVLNIAPEDN